MIQQGFLIDIHAIRQKLEEFLEEVTDPVDFGLRLKPYVAHVNSASLTRLYHALMKSTSPSNKLSAEAWYYAEELVKECRSNERVHELVLTLLRPYAP